jgi:hypothetical protein
VLRCGVLHCGVLHCGVLRCGVRVAFRLVRALGAVLLHSTSSNAAVLVRYSGRLWL